MKLVFAFLFTAITVFGDVKWPALNRPVVDQVGWFSQRERDELESWLYQVKQRGKGQVQVVIVPDLQGLPIETYSIQLMDRWKIGDAKRDDGILFVVAANDRKMRIEVGQGLEGVLTDLQSKRILDDRVRPQFRDGHFSAGIVAGVYEILSALDPEFVANAQAPAAPTPRSSSDEGSSYLFWIILAFFILSSLFGRGRRRGGILPFMLGYGLGSRGGGGWSGGGGGGWTGGGGGFSGGGASSDW